MKYSVIVALVGITQARHHHHSRLATFVQEEPAEAAAPAEEAKAAAPKEGVAKEETKAAVAPTSLGPSDPLGWANETKTKGLGESDEVVKKQQAAEGEVEKSNKENDDKNSAKADAKKAEVVKEQNIASNGGVRQEAYPTNGYNYKASSFVQMMDNEADVEFLKGKEVAAGVVAKQQAFENKKTADVDTRNVKDSKECLDLRTQVVTTHETRLKDFDHNVQMVYIPEQEIYLGLY